MHAKDPLPAILGRTDIYVVDQIMREHIAPPMRIFDAGFGSGRNIHYLLKAGYPVAGIDPNPEALEQVQALARKFAPTAPSHRFRTEPLEAHSFPDASFDAVLCNAVLHFAQNHEHFHAMFDGAWRLLDNGGLFFARLASSIGIENHLQGELPGWHRLPDGSDRYLVNEEALMKKAEALSATWVDPLKTTVVSGMRSMTTMVLRKGTPRETGKPA